MGISGWWKNAVVFLILSATVTCSSVSWSRKGVGSISRFLKPELNETSVVGVTETGGLVNINATDGAYIWIFRSQENENLIRVAQWYPFIGVTTVLNVNQQKAGALASEEDVSVLFRVHERKNGTLLWTHRRQIKRNVPMNNSLQYVPKVDIAFWAPKGNETSPFLAYLHQNTVHVGRISSTAFTYHYSLSMNKLIPELHDFLVTLMTVEWVQSGFTVVGTLMTPNAHFLIFLFFDPRTSDTVAVRKVELDIPLNSLVTTVECALSERSCTVKTDVTIYHVMYENLRLDDVGQNYITVNGITKQEKNKTTFIRNGVKVSSGVDGKVSISSLEGDLITVISTNDTSQLVDAVLCSRGGLYGILSFESLTLLGFSGKQTEAITLWRNEEALSHISQVVPWAPPLRKYNTAQSILPLLFPKPLWFWSLRRWASWRMWFWSNTDTREAYSSWSTATVIHHILVVTSEKGCAVMGLNGDTGDLIWKRQCTRESMGIRSLQREWKPFSASCVRPFSTDGSIPVLGHAPRLQILMIDVGLIYDEEGPLRNAVVVLWPNFTLSWISPRTGQDIRPPVSLDFPNSTSLHMSLSGTDHSDVILVQSDAGLVKYFSFNTTSLNTVKHVFSYCLTSSSSIIGVKYHFATKNTVENKRNETLWALNFEESHERIQTVTESHSRRNKARKIKFERGIQLEDYLTVHHVLVSTVQEDTKRISLYLIDMRNGHIVMSRTLIPEALPPSQVVLKDHRALVLYRNVETLQYELLSIELYFNQTFPVQHTAGGLMNLLKGWGIGTTFHKKVPMESIVESRSYILGSSIPRVMTFSETRHGITPKLLLYANEAGQLIGLHHHKIAATRPYSTYPKSKDMLQSNELAEINVQPYSSFVPISAAEILSQNATVYLARGILSYIDSCESSSHIFVYGLDLFFSKVYPVSAFDSIHVHVQKYLLLITVALGSVSVFMLRQKAINAELKSRWA